MSIAQRIADTLSVIIYAVDKSLGNSVIDPTIFSTYFVTDELAKLAILKEKEILTEKDASKLDLPQSDPFEDEVRSLIVSGQKITVYKLVVDTLCMDLVYAKNYVDNHG